MKHTSNELDCRYMPMSDTAFYNWLVLNKDNAGVNVGVFTQAVSIYLDFQSVRDSIAPDYLSTLRTIHHYFWVHEFKAA